MKPGHQSDRLGVNDRARGSGRAGRSAHTRARFVRWRRRHLNLRTIIVLVALGALLAPEAATIIDAAL